jgi:hypothetical protein
MIGYDDGEAPRPLFGRGDLFALCAGAALVLLLLMPLAQRRQQQAGDVAPSALSLTLLELSLIHRPADSQLRMQLTRKLIAAGWLARARATLSPLIAAAGASLDARMLQVEIDRRAWAASPRDNPSERATALQRVLAAMQRIPSAALDANGVRRLADEYRALEQPRMAAELLDRWARAAVGDAGDTSELEERMAAADMAWLEADLPLMAAELHAWAAELPVSADAAHSAAFTSGATERAPTQQRIRIEHARLAIERSRAGGDARPSTLMYERMTRLLPDDVELLELGVQLAEESDAQRAFELASKLAKRVPTEPKLHREVARLAEATGRSLRALDEYMWLVRHGGDEHDRARALALARANWDLPLVRELLEGPRARTRAPIRARRPHCQGAPLAARPRSAANRREQRERLALYEALGDLAAARRLLTEAVSSAGETDEALWQQKLELELRLGDQDAALATLLELSRRFPNRTRREQLADMQLSLGHGADALQTLTSSADEHEHDETHLRRVAALAWHMGALGVERRTYAELLHQPYATSADYQRAVELAPTSDDALALALAAFERFEARDMLAAAVAIYAARGDEQRELELLARAEKAPGVRSTVDYWQTRITLRSGRAAKALEHNQLALAQRELAAAETLTERAPAFAPAQALYEQLRQSQQALALQLGLASGDDRMLAPAYAAMSGRLSARERVYVLTRLGRNDEAFELARRAAASDDGSPADRRVLESDARSLAGGRARYVRASGEHLNMDGLAVWHSAAAFEYAGKAGGVGAEAAYDEYRPTAGAESVVRDPIRDVTGQLRSRLAHSELAVGVRVRDERSARPFGVAALRVGDAGARAELHLHVNDSAFDTARLRALGVRDAVALSGRLPIGKHVYVSARGLAEAYYTRHERSYLGAGATFDAAIGGELALPADAGVAGLRLVGRAAPRFAAKSDEATATAAPTGAFLPESTSWAGLGASLARGDGDAPPLIGRQFSYVLDAAAGWLWPTQGLGWSAHAGIGSSLLGADLLSLHARAGNVVGSTVWSASVDYGFTFDR